MARRMIALVCLLNMALMTAVANVTRLNSNSFINGARSAAGYMVCVSGRDEMPSKSKAQHNLMQMVAHNKAAAKRLGIPQKVGKEFVKADKKIKGPKK